MKFSQIFKYYISWHASGLLVRFLVGVVHFLVVAALVAVMVVIKSRAAE